MRSEDVCDVCLAPRACTKAIVARILLDPDNVIIAVRVSLQGICKSRVIDTRSTKEWSAGTKEQSVSRVVVLRIARHDLVVIAEEERFDARSYNRFF